MSRRFLRDPFDRFQYFLLRLLLLALAVITFLKVLRAELAGLF